MEGEEGISPSEMWNPLSLEQNGEAEAQLTKPTAPKDRVRRRESVLKCTGLSAQ